MTLTLVDNGQWGKMDNGGQLKMGHCTMHCGRRRLLALGGKQESTIIFFGLILPLCRGSALAMCLFFSPALCLIKIFIPVMASNLPHTSFISVAIFPVIGSKMRGAETWPGLVWCHLVIYFSFFILCFLSFHSRG